MGLVDLLALCAAGMFGTTGAGCVLADTDDKVMRICGIALAWVSAPLFGLCIGMIAIIKG